MLGYCFGSLLLVGFWGLSVLVVLLFWAPCVSYVFFYVSPFFFTKLLAQDVVGEQGGCCNALLSLRHAVLLEQRAALTSPRFALWKAALTVFVTRLMVLVVLPT